MRSTGLGPRMVLINNDPVQPNGMPQPAREGPRPEGDNGSVRTPPTAPPRAARPHKMVPHLERYAALARKNPKRAMEAALADLGDNNYWKRAAAQAFLQEQGASALPYLRKGEKSDNLEVRTRAQAVLSRLFRQVHPSAAEARRLLALARRNLDANPHAPVDQLLAEAKRRLAATRTGRGARGFDAELKALEAEAKELITLYESHNGPMKPDPLGPGSLKQALEAALRAKIR